MERAEIIGLLRRIAAMSDDERQTRMTRVAGDRGPTIALLRESLAAAKERPTCWIRVMSGRQPAPPRAPTWSVIGSAGSRT